MPKPILPIVVMFLGALAVLPGCSTVNSAMGGNSQKDAKAEIEWNYRKGAIQIELVSNDDLNASTDQSHTLVLGLFQLEDSKAFLQLVNDAQGLQKILVSGDPGQSALQLERYVVSPGKRTILTLDRVQNAKYLGLVAGYYQFDARSASRLFRIPLNIEKSGWVTTTYKAAPANLALRLQLGRQGITNAQSLTFDPDQEPNVESIPLDTPATEIPLTDQTLNQAEASAGAARRLQP